MIVSSIAVIGAGAGGLCTARAFLRRNPQATVAIFEAGSSVGGVWNYQQSDTHTQPLYKDLRTNLPKQVMGFQEFPFTLGGEDSYVSHTFVSQYLKDYAEQFDLYKHVRFNEPVVSVRYGEGKRFLINDNVEEPFDHVIVANGHYSAPIIPNLPNLAKFKGKIMHAIAYDDPSTFAGESGVLIVGGRASGSDLTAQICKYAKKVYLSTNDPSSAKLAVNTNIKMLSRCAKVDEDGAHIVFEGGETLDSGSVSTVIFATGYDYDFNFLNKSDFSNVKFGTKRCSPLYKQLFYTEDTNLSFVGLPWSIIPFPLMEGQANLIAAVACNEVSERSRRLHPHTLPTHY